MMGQNDRKSIRSGPHGCPQWLRGVSPGLKLLALRFEPIVDQALRRL
jgi:hypothetical protein